MRVAEAGTDAAITGRNLETAQEARGRNRHEEPAADKIVGFACDVRYEDQVSLLVDAVLAEFGRIDILVNNAGNVVSTPDNKPLEQRPIDEWDFTIGVNLTDPYDRRTTFTYSDGYLTQITDHAGRETRFQIDSCCLRIDHLPGVDGHVVCVRLPRAGVGPRGPRRQSHQLQLRLLRPRGDDHHAPREK